jgi:hypothetical protein
MKDFAAIARKPAKHDVDISPATNIWAIIANEKK